MLVPAIAKNLFGPSCRSSLDRLVRDELAESLEYLGREMASRSGASAASLRAAILQIRAHRVRPALFSLYYELVPAIDEGRWVDVERLSAEIAAASHDAATRRVLPFTRDALGPDMERYAHVLDSEEAGGDLLAQPDLADWAAFESKVKSGFELVRAADPLLSDELEDLVVEVVGASTPAGTRFRFEGASSFMLWGGVVLNVDQFATALDVASGLVHEGAHQLLFGLSRTEPLVQNSVEDRYDSPLRRDPRPMDGVFHATFVCARVHYYLDGLHKTAKTADQHAALETQMAVERQAFIDGLDTVRQYGRLSGLGLAVIDEAEAYMRRTA